MAIILKVNGSTEPLTDLSLESMQKAVGGYIEYVPLPDGRIMYCDEEGKLKSKPINPEATRIFDNPYDVVVGDVIIMEESEDA